MANKSIADDPSQWTTPLRENNIPRSRGDKDEPKPRLMVSNHTREDYHMLRMALNTVLMTTSVTRIARVCREALDNTPSDGSGV